ncbi:WD40/YVTN/BNR-like repeat-containing protein [Kangiella spongicola]|uniref:Photosynthesis system II assembly factor Ycf48/Hcf136-like domain-containing protein n=1 Tax=Kangiella spongicola TaxID=796379 RepID=A0A318D395_9GAMM|nr:YCF48-related protein [Kangiella spongicola]PXF63772.1 hypothetical protein DL796_01080 [Kangiella spongicola]
MKNVLQTLIISFIILAAPISYGEPAVIAPKAVESLLLDIVKVSEQRLLTVGQRGHILISEDQGQNWRQVEVPVNVNLTAVDFLDENHGVAVGFDQTVLLTEDAGETWTVSHQEVSNLQPALFSVIYNSKDTITAVGSYGLYLETKDGGATWENRQIDSLSDVYDGFSHFYDIEKLNADTWYIAGEKYIAEADDYGDEFSKGMIAVTKDAGRTWEKVYSPYEGSFFGITVKANDIYVYGLRGNLFHSKDGGANWAKVPLGVQAGLHDMIITAAGNLVLVGTGGVMVEKSAKNNKAAKVSKRSDLKGRAALIEVANEQFIIVGEGGVRSSSKAETKAQQ